MKYSEFKKAVEDWCKKWNLEALIKENNYWTVIRSRRRDSQLNIVAMIYNKKPYVLNLSYSGNMDLEHEIIKELSKIVTKFANTMPADREDKVKKYHLKHRFIGNRGIAYLNYRLEDESYTIWAKTSSAGYKSQFTMKEIESIKTIYDTDLKDFELVEVIE